MIDDKVIVFDAGAIDDDDDDVDTEDTCSYDALVSSPSQIDEHNTLSS